MGGGLKIKDDLVIPMQEIEIVASRSGGPGGQHVNKSSTRITARWNVVNTIVLSHEQKERVVQKLAGSLSLEGDLIVHNSASRSQQQNKEAALQVLAGIVRRALHVPKRRMKTRVPKSAQEARLQAKSQHSDLKKLRNKNVY